MHPYAAESRSRRGIYFALAVTAVLSAWGLQGVIEGLDVPMPWWVEMPSVLGFFGLYWKWFDVRLWRTEFLKRRGWLGIPDLRGSWNARVSSSHESAPVEILGEVRIEQTWSRLSVTARWPDSESYSLSAVLQEGPGMRPELVYTFVNEPRANAAPTMEMHRGTTWLRLGESGRVMEGHYYSGRGRQLYGDIALERS